MRAKIYCCLGLILILIGFISPGASAQTDTVIVDLELFIPNNGIFFVNDLNLTQLNRAPLLFAVKIKNYFSIPKQVVLRFGIRRNLQTLIDGTTSPFTLSPFPSEIYLTNHNILSEGQHYSIQNYDIGNATDELLNAIMAQGKLPTGEYQFFVEIDYEKNGVVHQVGYDEETIVISLSTTLDLIAPGQPAAGGELMELYTTLPFFQWHSSANKFRLTVCEKLPFNNSPQDVMNNEPRLQQIIEHRTFFQYPASGAWPLEPGKAYYWQIVAITESTSGPVELESEIWGFKIADLANGVGTMEHQHLVSLLLSILGDSRLASLFGNGGELDGYSFTGVVLNNGQIVSQEKLMTIILEILNNKIVIERVVVE